MLGHFGLRDAKNFLEVTDTKRTACQQMDDPQPRGVAETLVNRNQVHGFSYMHIYIYMSIDIFGHVTLRCAGIIPIFWPEPTIGAGCVCRRKEENYTAAMTGYGGASVKRPSQATGAWHKRLYKFFDFSSGTLLLNARVRSCRFERRGCHWGFRKFLRLASGRGLRHANKQPGLGAFLAKVDQDR